SAGSFTVMIGLTLLAMTYVGGITAYTGAVLAGIVGPLGVISVFLDQTLALGEYYELIAAALLMVMAVLNPVGAAGAMAHLRERIRQRSHSTTGADSGGTGREAVPAGAGQQGEEVATSV